MANLLNDLASLLSPQGYQGYMPVGGDNGTAPRWIPAQSAAAAPSAPALAQAPAVSAPQQSGPVMPTAGSPLGMIFPHSIFARMAAAQQRQQMALQTARWLLTQGVQPAAAVYLASNPTAMNTYLSQHLAKTKYGFMQGKNGMIYSTNPDKGTVAPIYRGQLPVTFAQTKDGTILVENPNSQTAKPVYQSAVPLNFGQTLAVPNSSVPNSWPNAAPSAGAAPAGATPAGSTVGAGAAAPQGTPTAAASPGGPSVRTVASNTEGMLTPHEIDVAADHYRITGKVPRIYGQMGGQVMMMIIGRAAERASENAPLLPGARSMAGEQTKFVGLERTMPDIYRTNNALNTGIGHMEELANTFQNLHNNNFQPSNYVKNLVGPLFGATGPTNYNVVKNRVAPEITKIWRGTGGAESDISRDIKAFKDSQTPAQGLQAIAKIAQLMMSKLKANQYQYESEFGKGSAAFMVSPQNRAAMHHLENLGKTAPSGPRLQPGQSTTINGITIERVK